MNKPPAFQFYANDWLGSTQIMLMSPAEEGAYIRLLAIAWNDEKCCLPNDDEKLAKLSRLGEAWHNGSGAIIRKCFKEKNNKLFNKRLLKEKQKIEEFRQNKISAGEKGAISKWGKMPGSTTGEKKKRSVRLSEARKKATHTNEEFQEMLNFFNGVCVKCESKIGILKDHIIPLYQGGSDGMKNLQPLCKHCNSAKGSDSEDYRISYCKKHNLDLPKKWIEMPGSTTGECLSKNSSSSSSSSSSSNKEETYVWEKYKEIFKEFYKREPELTLKRKFHIKARLEKFTVDELIEVMKKIRGSKYHIGENPSNRFYATPDYCFRNNEQTENWLNPKGQKTQNKWDAVKQMIKEEAKND